MAVRGEVPLFPNVDVSPPPSDDMAMSRREYLLNEYLTSLDTEDADRMAEIITDDFTYRYLDTTYEGKAETLRFMREERDVDTEHHFTSIVHGLEHSVGIGSSCGIGPHGEFQTEMCDVFTFNQGETKIRSVTIYTR